MFLASKVTEIYCMPMIFARNYIVTGNYMIVYRKTK